MMTDRMKRILSITIALLGLTTAIPTSATGAPEGAWGITVSDPEIHHSGSYMIVDMALNLRGLSVRADRAVVITPRLVNGNDSIDLPSVGIYGRTRYYQYVRSGAGMLTGPDETSYRASECPDSIAYNSIVAYQDWMNGATLSLHRSDYGCCSTLLSHRGTPISLYNEDFFPVLVYVTPAAEATKSRSVQGSAFIEFPVNQTVIDPTFRSNSMELGKISATIDSVRADSDATITQVWLKGYASPEGSYERNRDLAIGRTDALMQYLRRLYSFDAGIISTAHEAEDWDGLRRYVGESQLGHRENILAIIDEETDPDARELAIRRRYPADYAILLRDCYPALRHTDYRIAYIIRSYDDPAEIYRVMHESPQKLSLNELNLVASQFEPGTEEFSEVFETAVRMFPTDPTANLNAANAAMRRDDLASAARYLTRAGNSAEAVYARAALAIRNKDYDTARSLLTEAQSLGLPQATLTLDELNKGRR